MDIREEIKSNAQIKKFCLYGFFKNLKFFEPYLLIYLLSNNITLFQIGVLIAIREIIVNIFEVPSGFIADYFGRKVELALCFVFYILSFVIFIFSSTFYIAVFAMVFFGLGEAFRSGTHKAMIYTYLDSKNWSQEKTFVYGRTRSFSLIGSAISSFLGIILILFIPNDRYIFLFSVFPYILAFILILTYPNFLDKTDKKTNTSLKDMFNQLLQQFKANKALKSLLIEEGVAEGAFSYVKDLIQPLLEMVLLSSGIIFITTLNGEDNLKVMLGLIYAVMNLSGSYFSKNAYKLNNKMTNKLCLFFMHIFMAILFGVLSVFSSQYIVIILGYLVLFIMHSARKPLFIDEIDNQIDKSTRATMLSILAQIKSLFLIIFAPILGFIAEQFGINFTLISLCALFIITLPLFISRKQNSAKIK